MVRTMTKRTEQEKIYATIKYCRPYRGLRIGGRVWVYGDVIIEPAEPATDKRDAMPFAAYIQGRDFPEHCTERARFKVIPVTIGQSIGMQDKLKQDIYIDDIMFLEEKNLRRVEWCDYRYVLCANGNNIDISYARKAIVVGNAHQMGKWTNG